MHAPDLPRPGSYRPSSVHPFPKRFQQVALVAASTAVLLGLGAWRSHAAGRHDAAHPFIRHHRPLPPMVITADAMPTAEAVLERFAVDASTGVSGKVYLHVIGADESPLDIAPGVYAVDGLDHPEAVAVLRPFRSKLGRWVGAYQVGFWPAELHRVFSPAYDNPTGFIEVTPETEDIQVSAHFRLRDFITHDQPNVWPKMVVLREPLLDKLELVLDDLQRHGVRTNHAIVLSGFRTPEYNLALGDASGRARESRHQYGDAADIIIDADHDGRMDDLNHDGRVNEADVRVIEAAVNRVERAHPELAGGLGLYAAEGPHGPFAHVDVRGWIARWDYSRHRWALASGARRWTWGRHIGPAFGGDMDGRLSVRLGNGQCSAPPQFAALCGR